MQFEKRARRAKRVCYWFNKLILLSFPTKHRGSESRSCSLGQQVRKSTEPMTSPCGWVGGWGGVEVSEGGGAGLTRASLSSVVSDSACKDSRNFGVTGGKHRQQQPCWRHSGRAGPLTDPKESQPRKTLLPFCSSFPLLKYANKNPASAFNAAKSFLNKMFCLFSPKH